MGMVARDEADASSGATGDAMVIQSSNGSQCSGHRDHEEQAEYSVVHQHCSLLLTASQPTCWVTVASGAFWDACRSCPSPGGLSK